MNVMISSCKKNNAIYKDFLSLDSDLCIEDIATTESPSIEQYSEKKPDVFILDLTAENKNALYVLTQLSVSQDLSKEKIILIVDDNLKNIINHSQFSDVILTPITREKLLSSIHRIATKNSCPITSQNVKKLFLNLKIDLYSVGIDYLIDAILIAANNHSLLQNLQDIYVILGQKNNVSYDKIKWSIRSTIETIKKYEDSALFKSFFKYYDDTRTLTPKYFIRLVLYYFDIDADE